LRCACDFFSLIYIILHPGWRIALEASRAALTAAAKDHAADPVLFREDLMNIAMTTLSSKLLTHEKGHFASLAVDAILRLKGSNNLDHVQIIKVPGGSIGGSYLAEGFILNKKVGVGQPKRIENARILLANTAMDTDKIKIYGSRVRVDSLGKVAEIEEAERSKMRAKCEKITGHGVNCFINRQLIYNFSEQIFADANIMAIEHADFDGIERLAAVTGGEIASTFEHPELCKLGTCDLIEEIMIGEDKMLRYIYSLSTIYSLS
jgi:T-complex protein 1 subunit beta